MWSISWFHSFHLVTNWRCLGAQPNLRIDYWVDSPLNWDCRIEKIIFDLIIKKWIPYKSKISSTIENDEEWPGNGTQCWKIESTVNDAHTVWCLTRSIGTRFSLLRSYFIPSFSLIPFFSLTYSDVPVQSAAPSMHNRPAPRDGTISMKEER